MTTVLELTFIIFGGEINEENYFSDFDLQRDDPDLVRVVEELGEASSGP